MTVTKPQKAKNDETTEEIPELPDTPEVPEEPVVVVAEVPGRRPLGTKEPIVFKWKLLGEANGYVLTLSKTVEREDIDAHFERLTKEGYYKNLRVTDNNEKVVQPPQPKPAKVAKPFGKTSPAGSAKSSPTASSKAKIPDAKPVKAPSAKTVKAPDAKPLKAPSAKTVKTPDAKPAGKPKAAAKAPPKPAKKAPQPQKKKKK